MKFLNKCIRYIGLSFTDLESCRVIPDPTYLKMRYYFSMGKRLHLDNPKTFNEKLQWLKLYNRRLEYVKMVDKYEAKEYVKSILGEEYIIPTLGVWDRFEDIDFDMLPDQFVLKCTHDSNGLVICKDKTKLDTEAARRKINKSLKRNYYYVGREWPYKNVKPRIIAEKYMVGDPVVGLPDYKFFCFNGVCKCMKVDFDRFVEHRANYYDPAGNLLDLGEVICPPNIDNVINLPCTKDDMIKLAEKLSQDIPFLRVDFYDMDGKIYFGELTFYPASGFGAFTDEKWDDKLGEWLQLPERI